MSKLMLLAVCTLSTLLVVRVASQEGGTSAKPQVRALEDLLRDRASLLNGAEREEACRRLVGSCVKLHRASADLSTVRAELFQRAYVYGLDGQLEASRNLATVASGSNAAEEGLSCALVIAKLLPFAACELDFELMHSALMDAKADVDAGWRSWEALREAEKAIEDALELGGFGGAAATVRDAEQRVGKARDESIKALDDVMRDAAQVEY